MAKKRGLAANRGLDALLGSIKKEKEITAAALLDDSSLDDDLFNQNDASNPTQPSKISKSKTAVGAKTAAKNSSNKSKPVTTKNTNTRASTRNNDDTGRPIEPQSDKSASPETSSVHEGQDDEMCLVQMDVERLQAGRYQPRRDMSETALSELASSIRQHGVMQPIVIRPLLSGEEKSSSKVTHEIIAGERRWRAAKMAEQSTIPAIERALSDELAIALALIENIQREDLSVIEQAAALQRFHTEFGMSHAMIADVVGKARTTVSNLLRLNHLNDDVKTHLSEGRIDMGHARALLSLSSEQQPIIATKIIEGSMTVRDAEKLVKSILNPQEDAENALPTNDIEVKKLTQQLSDLLGTTVKFKQKKNGKGSVEIFYHSPEELEALLKNFK